MFKDVATSELLGITLRDPKGSDTLRDPKGSDVIKRKVCHYGQDTTQDTQALQRRASMHRK